MWAFTWYQSELLTPNTLEERCFCSWKFDFVFCWSQDYGIWRQLYTKSRFCVFHKVRKTRNQVFNFKRVVLQDYLELEARIGTTWKVTLSTFTLQTRFLISIHFRSSNLRKTNRVWIRFPINLTLLFRYLLFRFCIFKITHINNRDIPLPHSWFAETVTISVLVLIAMEYLK